jgi:hypothetical protein
MQYKKYEGMSEGMLSYCQIYIVVCLRTIITYICILQSTQYCLDLHKKNIYTNWSYLCHKHFVFSMLMSVTDAAMGLHVYMHDCLWYIHAYVPNMFTHIHTCTHASNIHNCDKKKRIPEYTCTHTNTLTYIHTLIPVRSEEYDRLSYVWMCYGDSMHQERLPNCFYSY